MRRALLLLPLLLGACYARPAARGPRPDVPDAAPPPSYWEAGGPVPAPISDEVAWVSPTVEARRILLPVRLPPELASVPRAKDPIEIQLMRSRPLDGRPRPVVVMSPILGSKNDLMCEFGTVFTRLGYHVALVQRKEFQFDPDTSVDAAEAEFRLLVMRSRQAVDWLVTRPDVDGRRLATFGISAGALISSILAGADDRFRAHVWVLAGGPLADVLTDTTEDPFRSYGEQLREKHGWTKDQIRGRLLEVIRTDPIRLAPRIRREDVLLFVARKDRSVPTRNGMLLWEALGRPALRSLPFDHYGAFSCFPWIMTESASFIGARLGTP